MNMKLWMLIALMVMTLLVFSGCKENDANQNNNNPDVVVEPQDNSDNQGDNQGDDNQDIGGDAPVWGQVYRPYTLEIINTMIADIVGRDLVMQRCNEFEENKTEESFASTKDNYDLLDFIEEFKITKEAFEQANFSKGDKYAQFTKEEIDVIFSGDRTAILKYFVNPDVVVFNEEAYTLNWFELHSVDEWKQEGIPAELITAALDKASTSEWLSYDNENVRAAISNLETKVVEYSKTTVDN